MILYEYPFNERLRTYLRLEQLFQRFLGLVERQDPMDHHFALVTMFEIIEVAARSDLKTEVLRELERQKNILEHWRNNPSIMQERLSKTLAQFEQRSQTLHLQTGKTGQELQEHELLSAIRSRLDIPGGINCFDIPAYHYWQHLPPEHRQDDLSRWGQSLKPLADALFLLLGVLRDTGAPQAVVARKGHFQQSLPANKSYQLLRLYIDPRLGLVPEISGNRLMVSVRLYRFGPEGNTVATDTDANLELALCI